MACLCVNELRRLLSGGSCFHDADDLPLRLASGIFSLVCALHAAADVSEVESIRRLRGCVVMIWDRFFSQPASSTSYAHCTRRLTYRRSRVSVRCAAGS